MSNPSRMCVTVGVKGAQSKMKEVTSNCGGSEGCESIVGDSLDDLVTNGPDLGQLAQRNSEVIDEGLHQNRSEDLGPFALGSLSNPLKEMGLQSPSNSVNRDGEFESGAVKLEDDDPINLTGFDGVAGKEINSCVNSFIIPTDLVRISQSPGINLMVDLKDAGCRRRRRRQLSKLMTLHEVEEKCQEVVADTYSSEEDPIQSNSPVEREVLATMAIGNALGIKFQPNSPAVSN